MRQFLPGVKKNGYGEVELRFRHFKTGAAIWMRYSVFTITDNAEQPAGLGTISRDISQAKQAREELLQTHQQTTAILESITDAFYALDTDWRFTYVNAACERSVHLTRAEMLGKTVWEMFPAAGEAAFGVEARRAMSERISVAYQDYYPPLLLWVETRIFPAANGISVYFRDITEHKEAEAERIRAVEELAASHARIDEVLESIADAFFAMDREWRFTYVNTKAETFMPRATGNGGQKCMGRVPRHNRLCVRAELPPCHG